jgi:hypothetical protein
MPRHSGTGSHIQNLAPHRRRAPEKTPPETTPEGACQVITIRVSG